MSIQSVGSSETFSDNLIQPVQNTPDEAPVERAESSHVTSLPRFMAEIVLHAVTPVSEAVQMKIKFDQFVVDLMKSIRSGDREKIQRLVSEVPPCPEGKEHHYTMCFFSMISALTFQECVEEAFELGRKIPLSGIPLSDSITRQSALDSILIPLMQKNQIGEAFKWGSLGAKEGWQTQEEVLQGIFWPACGLKRLDQLKSYSEFISFDGFTQESIATQLMMPILLALLGHKDKIPAAIESIGEKDLGAACVHLLRQGFLEEAQLIWPRVKDPRDLNHIQIEYCEFLVRVGREEEAFELIEKIPETTMYEHFPEWGTFKEKALIEVFESLYQVGSEEKAFAFMNDRISNPEQREKCIRFVCCQLAGRGRILEAYELGSQQHIEAITDAVCSAGSEADLEVLEKLLSSEEAHEKLHAKVKRELSLAQGRIDDALQETDLEDVCRSF